MPISLIAIRFVYMDITCYCVRTLTWYPRLNYTDQMYYKIGVACVYNGHVFYTMLLQHGNLIDLQKSTVRVMNSRVSG